MIVMFCEIMYKHNAPAEAINWLIMIFKMLACWKSADKFYSTIHACISL